MVGAKNLFGDHLIHGAGGGEDTGTDVGQPECLEEALDGAILPRRPVEDGKDNVDVPISQFIAEVVCEFDRHYLSEGVLESIGDALAGDAGDLGLGRGSTDEDSYADIICSHESTPHGIMIKIR
jgi:hypothetical protein